MGSPPGWLLVVDYQEVFRDPTSPWTTPRFDDIRPRVRSLVQAFGERVVFTRFVVPERPEGAWADYYRRYDYFTRPHAIPLFQLSEDPGARTVVDVPTFGKWVPEVADVVGDGPLTVAGVATDCCVLSTVLPAADAGVHVQVVSDACAGASDEAHADTMRILGCYAPLVEVTTTAEVLAAG
ncbi:cysteine hydrolase family protein [Geodermatophilus marinus]|uniref:cysteine hydrolase family protein n=1 Tax=Geodermatophilus sp. LHW52908 TaxID=2303986 RepID=UPI000E3D912A|nr:isochorismatase family cysteine hydrolase [Geodermatophilus sp. LHW52908]RFU20132.1 cysteine hydrolase [Geodermatophilus sp. LHW52908]